MYAHTACGKVVLIMQKRKNLLIVVSILILGAGIIVPLSPPVHAATTITVNSKLDTVADTGTCTLREAITAANDDTASGVNAGECAAGSGADTIVFAITGSADYTVDGSNGYTITLASDLPPVTEQLTIDGTSQTGSSCSPRKSLIQINATSSANYAIRFNTGSDNSTVQGLTINRGQKNAIGSTDNDGLTVRCNMLGVNPEGSAALGNPNQLSGVIAINANSLTIGGNTAADMNLFGGYEDLNAGALNMQSSDNNVIQGNIFGSSLDGTATIPNSLAIGLGGQNGGANNNLIGGTTPGAANVIVASTSGGMVLFGIGGSTANSNIIQGNFIGVRSDGVVTPGLENGSGILFLGESQENLVGGTTAGTANIIAGNDDGVTLFSLTGFSYIPLKNSVIGNTIYANTGRGISFIEDTDGDFTPDIGLTSHPTNDAGDPDTGPNNYINNPEITAITQVGNQITFTYDLDAADSPSDTYRVEFAYNDSGDGDGYGQGQYLIGSTTADLSGGAATGLTATFTLPSSTDITAKVFSATATAIDNTTDSGFAATSEYGTKVLGASISYTADATNNGNNDTTPPSTPASNTSPLATTGQKAWSATLAWSAITSLGASGFMLRRRYARYRMRS